MYLFGFSINALSLFDWCSPSHVVDDAIVVSRTSSAASRTALRRVTRLKAMSEVTGPIIAIALVLCAVFIRSPSSAV